MISTQAETVTFSPPWTVQAQFAGYYMAKEKGFYKDKGLQVNILYPSHSHNAISYLVSGKAQFINLTLSQAIFYKMNGIDLINVLQGSQVNSLMFVSHTPITSPASLQNKRIGIWNFINPDLVSIMLKKFGIKAKIVRFNSGVNIFLSHAVDVCLVYSFNEFYQLQECGYHIRPNCVMRLNDQGYFMPEGGLYTLRSYYEKHPATVRKFVQASKQGWLYAASNKKETIDKTMQLTKKYHISTNRYHQTKMLDEVLRLQKDPQTGRKTFRLSPKSFEFATYFTSITSLKYSDFVK
jgi:NitT/TauT family transport system substrate-binding protein